MSHLEYSEEQSREAIDSRQMFEAFEDARERLERYRGAMSWKTVSGRDYLYRKFDSKGEWKSLGPRSEESEAKYEAFMQGKEAAKDRFSSIRSQMNNRARFAKAAGLNRVPAVIADIARALDQAGLLGPIVIVGTNAIYAYEAMAACRVVSELLATRDVDFLWDSRSKVDLAGSADADSFLALLKRADKSFERSKQIFRAINKDGFMADLIKAEPKEMLKVERDQLGGIYDLKASGIGSLRWLVNSPKVEAIAIDSRGFPFRMISPDPRSFAIHKLWLSEQPNRNPAKAGRDREQAYAVANLVIERLPQYRFEQDQLKMFPKDIADRGMEFLS